MPKLVDHDDRRSRLAEAAADVIAGQGLDATGLREVARASDLTTGAVTHYFTSKAALIDAAYDAVMDRLLDRQAEQLPGGVTPEAVVAQLAAVLPGDAAGVRDWRVWLAFSARAIVDPGMQQRHRSYYARITAGLAAEFARGSDDGKAVADLVVAILDGLGTRMLLEPGDWPPDRVTATLARAMPLLFPNPDEVMP